MEWSQEIIHDSRGIDRRISNALHQATLYKPITWDAIKRKLDLSACDEAVKRKHSTEGWQPFG